MSSLGFNLIGVGFLNGRPVEEFQIETSRLFTGGDSFPFSNEHMMTTGRPSLHNRRGFPVGTPLEQQQETGTYPAGSEEGFSFKRGFHRSVKNIIKFLFFIEHKIITIAALYLFLLKTQDL